MKRLKFILRLATCLVLMTTVWSPASGARDEEFKKIKLDQFIEQEKKAVAGQGRRMIKMAVPVSFEAKMKRFPEAKKMSYVYTAMQMAGISPMPEVGHRMFVESGEGRIIPVYVEKGAAAKLKSGLQEECAARFLGYHVYSYAKGPAILVVDFYPTAR
ncbi:MAG: hypothetical protein HUN04_24835 [Desulfobacter sp.]|nr:MAG: hypothetical protein HUN04_24835 [Desulfobacter sp.]